MKKSKFLLGVFAVLFAVGGALASAMNFQMTTAWYRADGSSPATCTPTTLPHQCQVGEGVCEVLIEDNNIDDFRQLYTDGTCQNTYKQ